jgi:arylsulfatase A-like enzyme
MKAFLTTSFLFLTFLCLQASAQNKQSPNLVFVFPDEMRGQTLGFLGEEKVKTPVLDQFARESVYFSNAVSNYPVCSPTRAMLFSGSYPLHNKVIGNCTSASAKFGCELPATTHCWSDVLKEKGYSLGYIGKWHLDSPHEPYIPTSNNKGDPKWNEWTPPDRRHGFSYWHAYGTYDQHLRPMYWDTDAVRDSFKYFDEWGPEHEANKAIDFIRNINGKFRENGKPFALVVSMNPPHMGYSLVPQKYKDIFKDVPVESLINKPSIEPAGTKWGDHYRKNIKDYYAAIAGVDEQFGRILQVLKEDGLADNTIVVFTSDHGDCMGIHDEVTKNNPYEESMRVPLLIRYPGKLKPHTDDILLSTLDISPTLLGLMGYASSIPKETDGENLAGYLITGKGTKPSSQWYMRISDAVESLGLRGIRTDRYTFVIDARKEKEKSVSLFDRKEDPYQMKNIAGKNPGLEKELMMQLKDWLKKFNDPWLKNLH